MITPASLPKPFIPLSSPDASLETVGGKGLNLAKLARAGFPVPNGFLIPTSVYREFVVENRLEEAIATALRDLDATSPEDLSVISDELRTLFGEATVPSGFTAALEIGWRWLGARPVAVRSSATAEDLPELSFAGQQDTFLNVINPEAMVKAVVDCWSSLWTARAIGYRARNQIPHDDVALSVIVQLMVKSTASGVLFTANPLNGRRTETVIDATLGLGEALVGGHVEPDHYVIDTSNNAIIYKFQGSKSLVISGKSEGGVTSQETDSSDVQAIPDEVIFDLAKIGKEIETLYDFPQDIEWAWIPPSPPDVGGRRAGDEGGVFILQSRPVTSLYPLPRNLPQEPLKTLIGLHLIQGVMEPFTPLGQTAIINVLTGGGLAFNLDLTVKQQTAFYIAGERLWINVTPIVRHPRGHTAFPSVIKNLDPGIAQAFQEILQDPRLAPQPGSLHLLKPRYVARFVLPNLWRILRFLHRPEEMARQTLSDFDALVAETEARQQTSGDLERDFSLRVELLWGARYLLPNFVIPKGVSAVVAGMMPFFGILQRFSKEIAAHTGDSQYETLYLEIARGLPNNVTTEMDLSLWKTSQILQGDADSSQVLETETAADLAAHYQADGLPPVAQQAIATFLKQYGMRGLGEIDIGRPRWREDPTHIMGVLQSYLQIDDPALAPDTVFARGAEAAQAAAKKLENAVRQLPYGRIKARLLRFAVRRYRALAGLREAPKFFAIRMMGVMRAGLLESGEEMVAAGILKEHDDLFYLHIYELENLTKDLSKLPSYQEMIQERRSLRQRELRRKQIPRVLLSDGTVYYEGMRTGEEGESLIVGDPVSPGVVEGNVRVVFNPQGTQLEPGEILVCPGTDPAWTPLFLAAGGLVMETGGMMTHGSVVAREFGIPAVVGVHRATEQLQTGQRIRVDGSTGRIEILV